MQSKSFQAGPAKRWKHDSKWGLSQVCWVYQVKGVLVQTSMAWLPQPSTPTHVTVEIRWMVPRRALSGRPKFNLSTSSPAPRWKERRRCGHSPRASPGKGVSKWWESHLMGSTEEMLKDAVILSPVFLFFMWRMYSVIACSVKIYHLWKVPGSPVIETPHFQCRRHGFDPWSGN